jgi:hypothetical protein
MNKSRFLCALLPMLALSCADSEGPVLVDAEWNLSCPSGGQLGCASWAQETCIGNGGQRAIVGEHGQPECGDGIVAICEAVQRADGMRDITIEANVDRNQGSSPRFAFRLEVKLDTNDDSVDLCNVTITEDGSSYGAIDPLGACGTEEPSIEQPCQLSNISTEGNEVVFDVECDALVNSTTGLAVDVGAVGGGATTIRFANCTGF